MSTDTTATATGSIQLANTFINVDDPDAALGFYRDVLGFTVGTDVSNGEYRWVTVSPARQPELNLTIQQIGGITPTEEDASAMRDLMAKGLLGGLVFNCDDVDALFEHVSASGAEVLQEPADQFYGVRDCAFRDPAGNLVRFNSPLAKS